MSTPIKEINFDAVNFYKQRIATRLPLAFLEQIPDEDGLIDYWTESGNRIVGRVVRGELNYIDYIINPDD